MNLLAFALVLAAGILGVIVVVMNWPAKASSPFLLGLAVALVSAGVIVQDVFVHWSKTVHA